MEDKNYLVQFNFNCTEDEETVIVPILTKVYTCIPYWNDITQEQREEELRWYALSNFDDIGITIPEDKIESIEITEI